MTKKIVDLLKVIRRLKSNYGLSIIDSHIHPYDVMGVVHYDSVKDKLINRDYFKAGFLEKLGYNKLEKIISRVLFNYFPQTVDNNIRLNLTQVGPQSLINEMSISLVDRAVLLPIEPWLPTDVVGSNYQNSRFYILGSLDINRINPEDIIPTILKFKKKYNIAGLKLHPNLQNFKPQPKDNKPLIREKLELIYKTAAENNLYLLFHGGYSNFTINPDPRYSYLERSRDNGVLENYCDHDGNSELLGKYNVPIIIAHLGHYGALKFNHNLIKTIVKRYSGVYFDTAGVSSHLIKQSLEIISSERIIFGSDALYNRIVYNLLFVYLAVDKLVNRDKDYTLLNILGKNFISNILKLR